MEIIRELGLSNMSNIVDIIKIFYLCIFTYYMNFKLANKKIKITLKSVFIVTFSIIAVSIICRIIKNILGFAYNIIFMILLITTIFKIAIKERFTYALLVTTISLSINYIIFSISVFITYNLVII